MQFKLWTVLAFAVLSTLSHHSNAQIPPQWGPLIGHVTVIDPSGMGARAGDSFAAILFVLDQAMTGNPCATTGGAPAILTYSPTAFANGTGDTGQPTGNDRQMVNSKAVLSTLQLALVTGLNVRVWGFNGSNGICQVYEVQVLNQ